MRAVAAEVLPERFGYEWTSTTYQEQKSGNRETYIFALSISCVFLVTAALCESGIRPLVIILTVPLATFGAMVGPWLFDLPPDLFGQIRMVMLIGLNPDVRLGRLHGDRRCLGDVELGACRSALRRYPNSTIRMKEAIWAAFVKYPSQVVSFLDRSTGGDAR